MLNKLKFGDFIIIGVVLVMAGALADVSQLRRQAVR